MDRLATASLGDVLDKVQPAIAAGSVNVISVERIRQRTGDRWPKKREQVEAFVERTFSRLTQPGDIMLSLNDAEFVTVQPSVSRTAALSISANILKETLAFFLGKAAREDLLLFRVTEFVDGALSVETVSGPELDQVYEGECAGKATDTESPDPRSSSAGVAPRDELHRDLVRRVRLISPPDLELDLAITPEPTWNVGAKVVASFLLRQTISVSAVGVEPRSVGPGGLSPNMAGEAAIATIECAAEWIVQRGVKVALHAPIGLNAIAYSTSRFRILNTLRDLSPEVRRFLILDIVEISEGLPQGRLTEVVGMLSPYCRAVLARAPSEMTDVRPWRGCGLSGVTLECARLDPGDKGVQARLGGFARRAAQVALSSVAYDLPSRSLMVTAWASGFTHVGGPLLSAEVGAPEGALRMRPVDLFSKATSADEGA